jgi:hypothetical protein
MALDNTAVLKVGTGHFYTAPIGTAVPADLRAPGVAWTEMGHTSMQDILSSASEGGDVSTLGSLQAKTLRQSVASRTESYNMNLLQFDKDSLKLYYGANAVVTGTGSVQVPQDAVPTEVAWLVVFYDGTTTAGIYAPKASIFRSDDLSISDTENLAQLPLKVTPLTYLTNAFAIEFIPPKAIKLQATATASRSAQVVSSITVTNPGSGYASVPAVTISGGAGTGATATAVLTNGSVTSITVNNGGTGYTTDPAVAIAAP